jgi:tetratricopeptide (TPR) repeat protein
LGEELMTYDEDPSAVDEAVTVLHKGMIVDPLNYDCTNALARAYEKKCDLVNAIKYGKLATEQPNSNSNSPYFLGTLYMKKKDFKNAAESFRTLLRINNEHPEALIEYATISSI